MLAKNLKTFLKNNLGKDKDIPPEIMVEYLASCKAALESLFKKRSGQNAFRMSNLGKSALELWCQRKWPDVEDPKKLELMLTFCQGSLIESMLVALLRMSGLKFDTQTEAIVTIDGTDVRGRTDLVLNEGIIDIKTCNDRSYKEKFKDSETVYIYDSYGYYAQGAGYAEGTGKPFLGWLAFNKNTSEIRDVEADLNYLRDEWLEAKERVHMALSDEMPPLPPPEHEFNDDCRPTGNILVPRELQKSPYVQKLYPDAVQVKNNNKTKWYIKYVTDNN